MQWPADIFGCPTGSLMLVLLRIAGWAVLVFWGVVNAFDLEPAWGAAALPAGLIAIAMETHLRERRSSEHRNEDDSL